MVDDTPSTIMLGYKANPEVQKLLNGGVGNGPKIRPTSHSFLSAVSMTSGC